MMHPWPVSWWRGNANALLAASIAAHEAGCVTDAVEPIETPPHSLAEPWQPEPFAIDAALLAQAEALCRRGGMKQGLRLAAVDARGSGRIWIVYAGPNDEADCLFDVAADGSMTSVGGGSISNSAPFGEPVGGALTVWSFGGNGTAAGETSNVIGQAGPNVASVKIATKGGRTLRASRGPTGWFAAWWPGADEFLRATGYDALGNETGNAQ
jgi:hypothetical protein